MATYYLIRNRILGRREDGIFDLLENGKWISDVKKLIQDRLIGFDPYEPEDSPYRTGNLSIMDEIEEIPEEMAMQLLNILTIEFLKDKWKKDIVGKKAEWDKDPGWPAKMVETGFMLNGTCYVIKPGDLGLKNDCWDQGFMESIQGILEKDLETFGATEIRSYGFID